jgi:stage V sporulation protein D (sporulation-specific penicillin-binding protein)
MKEKERAKLRIRAAVLFWGCAFVASILLFRLFSFQVREGAGLAALAGQEQRATFKVDGRRGDIVDRFGAPFATNIASKAISVRPADVGDAGAEAKQLSGVLGIGASSLAGSMRSKEPFLYLKRDVSVATAQKVERLALRGIEIDDEPLGLRVDPQGRSGSTLVGFTGVDNQGLAGIEYAFNDVLTGKSGTVEEDTDNDDRPIPFGGRTVTPAVVGDTVVLTIDRMLEFEAEDILRQTVERYHADGGCAIVMRAQTGEILALANEPNFDPNDYSASSPLTWVDRAITDPYEPGSTFKIVTATAALDSGKVSLDDTFPAVDAIEVGDRTIHNADDGMMASGHSRETLDDIVAYSHNVGAAEVAMRIGKQTMYEYIRRFGLDEPTGVDLSGESGGLIGTPDEWYGSRIATIGFGQGVSVTALQLARAYAAVANGGLLMRPLVVRAVIAPNGSVVKKYEPQVVRRVMKPQTAAEVLAMLRDVFAFGTANAIKMPGYDLAGKTGTAQMVIDGAYVPGAYTASFVGIVPADRPQYVILIKIDRPMGEYYGSIVAAPAFADLASRVLWREGVLPKHAAGSIDDPTAAARSVGRRQPPGNGRRL